MRRRQESGPGQPRTEDEDDVFILGRELEADAFPDVKPKARGNNYLSYWQALRQAMSKEAQPWNPTSPNQSFGFARRLREEVIKELAKIKNVKPVSLNEQVGIFTCVGSPLDRYHGVDAVIALNGDPRLAVTLDVSDNPHKADGYMADLMISPQHVYGGQNNAPRQELARQIAQHLVSAQARQREAAAQQPPKKEYRPLTGRPWRRRRRRDNQQSSRPTPDAP